MLSRQQIDFIASIDDDYIIGGSHAMMLYIGHDVRQCKDLDLHLSTPVDKSIFSILGDVDIFYDSAPYVYYNNVRLIPLEKLIANKLNRVLKDSNGKDLYDLFFLLDLDFNLSSLRKYVLDLDCNLRLVRKHVRTNFYTFNISTDNLSIFMKTAKYTISVYSCINKIKGLIIRLGNEFKEI